VGGDHRPGQPVLGAATFSSVGLSGCL
jgi:hypothetical protein